MGALLALIPLIGSVLPALIPALGTPLQGNILSKAADAAMKIFGTVQANEIDLAIQKDKSLLDKFKAELEANTEEEKLAYADLASARQQTVELAKEGSLIAWGAPIMSILVTLGFFIVLGLFVTKTLQLSEFQQAVLNILVGFLGSSFGQTVNYWLGTSRGSATKDAAIQRIATNAIAAGQGQGGSSG